MSAKKLVQYGLWPSPLSPQAMAQSLRLGDAGWNTSDGALVWLEGRSGRGVLVALADGESAPCDLTPARSVQPKVGYGGGAFTVDRDWVFYAAADGRLYRQPLGPGPAQAITPPFGHAAAPAVSPDGRFVLYVHTCEGEDVLAAVDAAGAHWPRRLAAGADFYMQPVWSPDGARAAWVEWDHPHMPWDAARLVLAEVGEAAGLPRVTARRTLVEGEDLSVFQPAFSPDGRRISYVADPDGWWRLYVHDLAGGTTRALSPAGVEAGVPAWLQGMRTHGFSADGRTLYWLENDRGRWSLWSGGVDGAAARRHDALDAYTALSQPSVSPVRGTLALLASASDTPTRLIRYDPASGSVAVVRRSEAERLPPEALSRAEPVTWRAGAAEVHGLFSPPAHPHCRGEGRPPLVVLVHGGPTSQRDQGYEAQVQFFTTRGIAVLQVNHRGSTGYGRAYRDALRGQWGAHDVEDCVSGARALADAGRVDPDRRAIMGGSAGGLTVLLALIRHPGFFRAGVCLYGVTNQFTLAADTHKFEARYSEGLLGRLPEAAAVYRERSPLFFAEQISDPVALFQGADDRVVPRAQSDEIAASLRRRGVPHVYHVYEGEGHGWRRRETVEAFYGHLEAFLRQHFAG